MYTKNTPVQCTTTIAWLFSTRNNSGVGIHRPTASLATLEQSITPAMVPPGPLRALVGRITQSVVRGMLRDLQEAARRISSGELQWPPNEGCC